MDTYLEGYGTLSQIQKDSKVNKKDVKEELENRGYIISKGVKLSTVINLKKALDEYMQNYLLIRTNKIHSAGSKAFVVNFVRKTAFTLIHYLYNDSSIYLQRKYDKYKEFCRVYQE